MRKRLIKMMVVAGVAALTVPGLAMAEWDQSESHNNQDPHGVFINVDTQGNVIGDFSYSTTSPIGYEYLPGQANMVSNNPFASKGQAPWNTTPCPINSVTPGVSTWEAAMGNCPTQVQASGWTLGQTDKGWGEGDNEMFGPILDDLYQSLTETASTPSNENGEKAFKKVDQVLDILFYRGNTAGEVYGVDGWTEDGPSGTGNHWVGGLGIDQTLDQDVADIEGTTAPGAVKHGTWLWNYDHVAQTFYQDFRIFDKHNQTGGVGDVTGEGDVDYKAGTGSGDWVDLSLSGDENKYKRGQHNPRTRHGIEILVWANLQGVDTYYDTHQGSAAENTYGLPGWGLVSSDKEDFAFFDQWVIQSLRDSYEVDYSNSPQPNFSGFAKLEQSYSSWMAVGIPGNVCEGLDSNSSNSDCAYTYKKDAHQVDKSIAGNVNTHQTGDP